MFLCNIGMCQHKNYSPVSAKVCQHMSRIIHLQTCHKNLQHKTSLTIRELIKHHTHWLLCERFLQFFSSLPHAHLACSVPEDFLMTEWLPRFTQVYSESLSSLGGRFPTWVPYTACNADFHPLLAYHYLLLRMICGFGFHSRL